MNFGFTEEQELLRSEVRKFLEESCPLEKVRSIGEGAGFDPTLWRQIADLGWLGLLVPEEHGGAGLGWVDLVVVLEETGRSLLPSPLLATTLFAHALVRFGSDAQKAELLPRIASGEAIGTLALMEADDVPGPAGVQLSGEKDGAGWTLRGEKLFVPDAEAATHFLTAFRTMDGVRLAILARGAAGVSAASFPGIDLTKRVGRLSMEDVRVEESALLPGADAEALGALFDAGATAVATEAVGAAEAALDLTVRYARERIQFGRPIGQFQGVKHPLAESYVDIESWKSLAYYAAWCIDEGHADAPLAASRAKAYASECFPRIGIEVIQLHGGIGYTWEYDAHLYLKRAKWMRPVFGDADWHYERVAQLGGL
jgi:alkylation response protein AidB-like acyl-CoA dehydrogenase